jgi:dipicolinate synthase subunit A
MLRTVSVIGGDLRQLTLASLLGQDSYEVKIFGFDKQIETAGLKKAKDIKDAANAEIIILPLPASHDNIILNSPFSENEISIQELFEFISPGKIILGGKLSSPLKELCLKNNIKIYDYFEREELSVANAIPTAEGAIEIALSETPYTLHNASCLVIGYGRIGKILADRLKAFGADVTVSARKYSDFAWIEANNFKCADSNKLDDIISDCKIIFNTVPSMILSDSLLKKIPDSTLVIDLASKPGGVDFSLAKELGLKVIWALSLPGKVAPITSGEIIKNTIVNILKEMEEL